jgi:uncharacterized protein YjdB
MKDFTLRKLLLFFLLFISSFTALPAQGIIIGHKQAHLEDLKRIPPEWIDSAKANLRIAYWRTSHGGQVLSGMNVLDAFMGGTGLYSRAEEKRPGALYLIDYFADLSAREETWPQTTRGYLDDPANQDINVVMWSWCQILGHDGDQYPGYASKMEGLIAEYGPGGTKIANGVRKVPVQFVFMTGHLNGQGEEGRTNQINTYIRNHCIANNRILYDFADIESYDPDDNYFLDDFCDDGCNYIVNGARTGNWAKEWVVGKVKMDGEDDVAHNEPNGGQWFQSSAEHSHALNANMKAYAAWYLFARLAGWENPVTSIDLGSAAESDTIKTDQGTLQMTARVLPDNATDTALTWSVINGSGMATISPSGLLQAVANGSVLVVAEANDGSGTKDSLSVTIFNQKAALISSITLSGEGGSTRIDQDSGTLQIDASILPAHATDTTLAWSVINGSGAAIISQTGLLQAVSNGTVTVVAAAIDGSGISDSLQITISNQIVLISSIYLSGEGGSTTIDQYGGSLQIYISVLPDDATDKTVKLEVVNATGRATISSTGLLQAVSDGMVVVVARANDGSGIRDNLAITISGQTITGIGDLEHTGIHITTDPVHKLLNIRCKDPSEDPFTLRIYNILGQLEFTGESIPGNSPVDISCLGTGYYIVQISKSKKEVASYKLLLK